MFSVKVDMMKIPKQVDDGFKFAQYVVDNQVLKDSNAFVPKDQGYLEDSGILHSKIGKGEVAWETPYARRLYYNPQYNFSKDKNPQAQGLWFEAAKSQQLKTWLKMGEEAAQSFF